MTLLLVLFTVIVSVSALYKREMFNKLKLNPYMVYHKKQWYRMISHGFVHADGFHLAVNMLVLFSFGDVIEMNFIGLEMVGMLIFPKLVYVLFYLLAIVVASTLTLKKYKDHHWYNSVGASGGVAAIVFAAIFFDPYNPIYLFFIPIPIPGILFGLAYLVYSYHMSTRGNDNINHEAHFVGAVFGLSFPIIINPKLFFVFVAQLFNF